MSANEKDRFVNLVKKSSSAKLETIETCIRPRFASHTLSSLMKKRTPMNPKKKSSSTLKTSKRSQKSIVYNKMNGIYRRRSVIKQNKSMQILITSLLQRENKRNRCASVRRMTDDKEMTGTKINAENTLIFLPNDLIKDVSGDLKKYAASPIKSMIFRKEREKIIEKIIDRSEKRTRNVSRDRLSRNKTRRTDSCLSSRLQNDIENVKDRASILYIFHQSRNEEKKFANSHREVKILHHRSRPGSSERSEDKVFAENLAAIVTRIHHRQSMSTSVNDAKLTTDIRKYPFHRGNRKNWTFRKTETKRDVDVDRAFNNLQNCRNSKFARHAIDNSRNKDDRSIVNDDAALIRKKGTFQKNLVFTNQRIWRPPGVNRSSIMKSTISLTQPTLQKSSRSIEKSIASTDYSSIEHVEIFNSESKNRSISVNQSRMLMKENQDPRANDVTKICEHLTSETKQRERLQNEKTFPKRRRSNIKIGPKTSNNSNDTNSTRSRSRSHHWQTVTSSRESSRNLNESNRTAIYNRRSRPEEVIHALKEINGVKEDKDVEENAVNVSDNNIFNNKESVSDLQTLSNRDTSTEISRNDETHIVKNKRFDDLNQSSWKSISTQTEEDPDSTKILKFTQIATQSSPSCNNVVETGCNTIHYNVIYKNAGISCNLMDSTNSKADIDSIMIEDKTSTLEDVSIHTDSITYAESNIEDESKKLSTINECKRTLSSEMTLTLEDYDIMETPAKTNNFIRDEEKIMDENSQTFLKKLSKNSDDKTNIDIYKCQVSTKYSSDSIDNLFSKTSRSSSSIYDYDASCSSEELAEYVENDVQSGQIVMSELKVENIPSDLIVAFELAAERARNLHKAIIICYENVVPKEIEKQNEEMAEKIERCASFVNHEIENRQRSECDVKYHRFDMVKNEDIDELTCSSRSSSSVLTDYYESMDEKDVKSLTRLLMQKKYAVEALQSKNDKNDDGDFEAAGAIKTLALSMTVEKPSSIISRENLLPLIYCILCSVIFWYLQVSFQCKPAT